MCHFLCCPVSFTFSHTYLVLRAGLLRGGRTEILAFTDIIYVCIVQNSVCTDHGDHCYCVIIIAFLDVGLVHHGRSWYQKIFTWECPVYHCVVGKRMQ